MFFQDYCILYQAVIDGQKVLFIYNTLVLLRLLVKSCSVLQFEIRVWLSDIEAAPVTGAASL